jgi:pimeloyl-ACP methyl ester carboxylesterase
MMRYIFIYTSHKKTMSIMNLEIITEEPTSDIRPTSLLFVHGMYHGAWCWSEHFLPYFAQHGYESHAVNLRGHGASEGSEELRMTSIADYVEDVSQVIDGLGKPSVPVGHSMGGYVVQKYLESHHAPAAVLLASAPPRGLRFGILRVLRVFRHFPLATLKARLTLSLLPVVNEPNRYKKLFFSEGISDEKVKSYFARVQDDSLRATTEIIYTNIKSEKITTPFLVLGAENDFLVSPKEIGETARVYNAESEIFPEMAHDMMLETGWQAVADRILGWLNKQGL